VIKRNELANPNSCLNKAADDEPLFVFRANDPLAPQLVREWADQYFDSKKDKEFRVTIPQTDQVSRGPCARQRHGRMEAGALVIVYTHVTYTLADYVLVDDVVITPKQQREIGRKLQEALDRSMRDALTGGYYVPVNDGRTLEHVPRRQRLEKKP